ncbi:MAG: hypothetical protein KC591_11455, partial [Gemmatimonadetes bacterium]|nr:hypothetical protein [Gemmatimonadota bacterium]
AGDALGGGVIQGVLLLTAATGLGTSPTGATTTILLALAVALGLAGLLIARRLDRGYTGALEESLLDHGRPSGTPTAAALESHSMFFPTLTQLDSFAIAPELEDALESIAPDDAPPPTEGGEEPRPVDPRRRLLDDLRSRRPERVK